MGVTWASWCLKSLATQQMVKPNIKENIKALHYWPIVRGASLALCEVNPPLTGGFTSQRASDVKTCPYYDVIKFLPYRTVLRSHQWSFHSQVSHHTQHGAGYNGHRNTRSHLLCLHMRCVHQLQDRNSRIDTLRPRQNDHHFTDDTFKSIFLNENFRNSIKISLKFVPKRPVNNIPTLVLIMALATIRGQAIIWTNDG